MGSTPTYILLAYLVAAVLFIVGLMWMSSPKTSRKGNMLASIGMLIAVIVTLLLKEVVNYAMILAGIFVGGIIGVVLARMVKMTQMPQMVGMLNGFGGAASLLIAMGEFFRVTGHGLSFTLDNSISIVLTVWIGAITFAGSMVAFGKLQGLISGKPITFPMQNMWNGIIFLAILAMMVYLVVVPGNISILIVLALVSLVLGILLVIPIGGADMPVVISLLNSYSGVAGAAAGFVIKDMFLIIAGALVGAAGFILTRVMCKAMNRSLTNVMFGAFGATTQAAGAAGGKGDKVAHEATVEDVATMLAYAQSVIFVPGYGLATSQAQHLVKELANVLEGKGIDVKYAVHPVAGRMPGHMNVLLAEADVPYDKLFDLDSINNDFERTDVAVVVGANDVTNPVARNVPDSPLYGMPILNVDKAKSIIVIKRSLSPGFAGIDNPLFYMDKTKMFFRDGKQALTEILAEIKNT
ncbi:MAG: NAD(P)(+) transhydrogenase (Re/Si-specific) subunit beta [Dehalococcoidales bacterium]|nr:NAD(P)(+) transhydrogenase (Re/Si-specific) subunit beta [Dehalococcoidales bacterium]